MIRTPAPTTLLKYGFGMGPMALGATPLEDWEALLDKQRGACGVCGRGHLELPKPRDGGPPRLNIDHEHVRGWKLMSPEMRRQYVRGLCCTRCNHYVLTRFATAELHILAAEYLVRYDLEKKEVLL